MSRSLSFAILGCGSIAETHARAIRSLAPSARLAALCDLESRRAEKMAREFGGAVRDWQEVLRDREVEAVVICTPSGLHAAHAAEALRAGKHALVEKPFDISAAACAPALEAAHLSGKVLSVVSQHRFDPASQQARKLVETDALGKVFGVDVRIPWFRTQEYYDSGEWRGTRKLDGGGCLINQGVHTLDLMLWLGGPVRRVWARMLTAAHERIEVEDHLCATLEFASGAIGNLSASTATYPGFPTRLELAGTEGTVVLEGDELQTVAIRGRDTLKGVAHDHARAVASGGTRGATEESAGLALGEKWVWGDAHRAQMEDFIQACQTGRPPRVTGIDGMRAVELIAAVYHSARTATVVEL